MANSIKIDIELEGDDALRTLKKLDKALNNTAEEGTKGFKKLDNAFASFAGNLGAIVATRAFDFLKDSIVESVQLFREFERGLTAVAKTTNFTDEEVERFGKTVDRLTKEIPATTDELLGIAEAAGQLGVNGIDNVEKFTETIAKLGRVSNLEGDFAATTLTRILNISGESIGTIDTLADVIVDLGNNFAASEAEIAAVTNEIARGTQNFGVASAEAAALATALRSLGVRAEEAGGVINRSFIAIDSAIRAGGKSAARLSEITGIAEKDLKNAFGTDAIGVFQKFTEGLGRIGQAGGSISLELDKLGLSGVRVNSILPSLANNSNIFSDALSRANRQVKEGGAVNEEFGKILDDTDTKIKLFSSAVDDLQKTLFSKVSPAFNNVTDVTTQFINKLSALAKGDDIGAAEANIKGLEATLKDVQDTTSFINRFLPEFAANINQSFADDRIKRLKEEIKETKGELKLLNEEGNNGAIAQFNTEIAQAEAKLTELKDTASDYIRVGREVFPKSPEAIKKQNAAIAEQTKLIEELKAKQGELSELRGAQAAFEAEQGQKKLEVIRENNQKEIEAEQEKLSFLDEIARTRAEDAAIAAEEAKLARELENEEDFHFLSNALGREEAARELFRIKNITDEKKRLAEVRKLRVDAQKKEEQRQKVAQQNEIRLDLATQQAKVNILSATASLATAIGKQGSKELFLIQKAAALAQAVVATNTAAAQALAVPPAPNVALAKLAKIAGGINIAAISATAIKGFQSGGIAPEPVAGGLIESPSQTGDQTLIGVNGGEVIFNKRQQQNLFDAVNRGNLGGGGSNITINNPVLLDEASVDTLIDQINDRVEFANRELKSTEVVDAA